MLSESRWAWIFADWRRLVVRERFGARRTVLLAAPATAAVKSLMTVAANMVEVAALVGDTARANMLAALMGGQSLTASELAYCARVSRSTASGHLPGSSARGCSPSTARAASPTTGWPRRWSRECWKASRQVAAIERPPRHRPPSARRRCAALCPHLLRPSGRPARRRADRRAVRARSRRSQRRGRRGHAGRRTNSSAFGVDLAAAARQPPDVLPALPRLERAPLSPQGHRRRGPAGPLSRSWLVQARARQPRVAADPDWGRGRARRFRGHARWRGVRHAQLVTGPLG